MSRLAIAVAAILASAPAVAQQNMGFESADSTGGPAGWDARDVAVAVDSSHSAEGRRSLRLEASGYGLVRQRLPVDALAGRAGATRVRLRGLVRTEGLDGGAVVWVRADGPDGVLALDNLWDQRLSGTTGWTFREATVVLPPETTHVLFGAYVVGAGTAWADSLSLDALAPETDAPAVPEAAAYLGRVLDLAQTRALHRDSVDWPAVRASATALSRGARATADTYPVVRYVLNALGDRHSHLMDPGAVAAMDAHVPADGEWPRGETLRLPDGRVAGYLWAPGILGSPAAGQTYADTLHAAIRRLDADGACGYVVDLRDNPGGDAFPMVAGLRPLLGEGPRGGSVDADGAAEVWTYGDGVPPSDTTFFVHARRPARLRAPDPPVAVLTGPKTGSAGEVVAVSFRGRPRTRSFGAGTAGLSTANDYIELSDGSVLLLTVSAYADRTGRVYGGVVEPDEPVEPAPPGTPLADDPTVRAALAWLGTTCTP